MINRVASFALLAVVSLMTLAYAVRRAGVGPFRAARLDEAGSSALLGTTLREASYWALRPLAVALARRGISPDLVTLASLALGGAAALAIASSNDGVGAVLLALSCTGDALDGFVARERNVASPAGEVLDAMADRYQELFVLSAFAFRFQHDAYALFAVMGAVGGSFMVSYVTAKSEAMGVAPPRGVLRRAERAAWVTAAVALTPVAAWAGAALHLPAWTADAPALVVLVAIGVIGNASAIARSGAVMASLRGRHAPPRERAIAVVRGEAMPHGPPR